MIKWLSTIITAVGVWAIALPAAAAEPVLERQDFLFYFAVSLLALCLIAILAWIGNRRLRQLVIKKSQELKATEEEYHTLIGDLNISLFRVAGAPEGRIIRANTGFADMFG